MAAAINVLSVGPVDHGSMVHDALLDGSNFRLTIATDYLQQIIEYCGEYRHSIQG